MNHISGIIPAANSNLAFDESCAHRYPTAKPRTSTATASGPMIAVATLKNTDLELLSDLLVWEKNEDRICHRMQLTKDELAALKCFLD